MGKIKIRFDLKPWHFGAGAAALSPFAVGPLKDSLRRRASVYNAKTENPELSAKIVRDARRRHPELRKLKIERSDTTISRAFGPRFFPGKSRLAGPTSLSRKRGYKVLATVDDPPVIAHELGHAIDANRRRRMQAAHEITSRSAGALTPFAIVSGKPRIAAGLGALASSKTLLNEWKANRHARKMLRRYMPKKQVREQMRGPNRLTIGNMAGEIANVASTTGIAMLNRAFIKALNKSYLKGAKRKMRKSLFRRLRKKRRR